MESAQHIKQRIGSIQNIGKITNAMELVAATKMRKSQEIALSSRPYAITAIELLANLNYGLQKTGGEIPAILARRPIEKTAVVIVTSDKGLAGAFNSNVLRRAETFFKEHKIENQKNRYVFIPVGNKALQFCEKKNVEIAKRFTHVGDYTLPKETKPISDLLVNGFLHRDWDEVITFSTHFRTALKQEVLQKKIFPIDTESLRLAINDIIPEKGRFSEFVSSHKSSVISHQSADYLIEPSPSEALSALIPHLITMEIYYLVLEANASEHAARRAAMKNATDNARDLGEELTLQYNKSRQAAITTEIIEISAGAEALQ